MLILLATCAGCGASGPLYDTRWGLESMNGRPPIEDVIPSLRVYSDKYGGYDGCNGFSVDSGGGPPFGPARDDSSVPGLTGTLRGCETESIGEQAEAYVETLMQGASHRIVGDRLEIFDGAGNARLVFRKQTVLPGRSANLDGTQWQLLVDGEDGGVSPPTLVFLSGRVVVGSIACGNYVSDYSLSDRRIHFPFSSMTGFAEFCEDESRQEDRRFMRDLEGAREYSVDGSTGKSLLRLRTVQGKVLLFELLLQTPESIFSVRWSLGTFVEPLKMGATKRHSYPTDVLEGTEITIEFGESGVAGSAGCNSYTARLEIQDAAAEVRDVSTAGKWCIGSKDLMEQEQRYLDILSRASRFRIFGERLVLHTDDDEFLLLQTR